MARKQLKEKFGKMKLAYKSLFVGSTELLELNSTYWTERILLRLVRNLSKQRLLQTKNILSDELESENETILKENMLEAQVNATLGGHFLGQWEKLEDRKGYQAVCSSCGRSVYVSDKTFYSILEEACPNQFQN